MTVSRSFRIVHRWVSVAFIAGVVLNFAAMQGGREPEAWVYLLALIPLALLALTGVYLFVLPYTSRLRRAAPLPTTE